MVRASERLSPDATARLDQGREDPSIDSAVERQLRGRWGVLVVHEKVG
jgi:hypothetical protein